MNIPFVPADSSNYYSGRGGNSIKYIVMHYTANDGDTDEGNAHYFQGAGRRASAHYFVDEDSVTQSVRDSRCSMALRRRSRELASPVTRHLYEP